MVVGEVGLNPKLRLDGDFEKPVAIDSRAARRLKGGSSIPEKSLNPGLDSIGVRVPDYNFIRVIARGFGTALALTSANFSGKSSSVDIKDFENLGEHCAYIYHEGVLPSGCAGATVVEN